jgi:hypothetical protein
MKKPPTSSWTDDGRRCLACSGTTQTYVMATFRVTNTTTGEAVIGEMHHVCVGSHLTKYPETSIQLEIP